MNLHVEYIDAKQRNMSIAYLYMTDFMFKCVMLQPHYDEEKICFVRAIAWCAARNIERSLRVQKICT
jgi:hypothetical protein